MIAKLNSLAKYLQKFNYHEYDEVIKIIKLSSVLGVDYPAEEIDKDGIDEVLKYLDENPGKFIFLDNPEGTEKRFGQKNYREMPFHYGEFIEINNPADDMGWDVIIVPSSSEVAETEESEEGEAAFVPAGHDLIPVGYVPVNDNQAEWTKRTKSKKRPKGKPAPVGNDKIILAPNGIVTDKDKKDVEDFFDSMWNFKKTVWL